MYFATKVLRASEAYPSSEARRLLLTDPSPASSISSAYPGRPLAVRGLARTKAAQGPVTGDDVLLSSYDLAQRRRSDFQVCKVIAAALP
jgi:hypothetical protein